LQEGNPLPQQPLAVHSSFASTSFNEKLAPPITEKTSASPIQTIPTADVRS